MRETVKAKLYQRIRAEMKRSVGNPWYACVRSQVCALGFDINKLGDPSHLVKPFKTLSRRLDFLDVEQREGQRNPSSEIIDEIINEVVDLYILIKNLRR